MRVSERHRYDTTGARVERAKQNNEHMLEIMSTQKKINKLSDDPIGMGRAILEKNLLENNKQYQRNIEFSKGYLERTEAALSGIMDYLIRSKELSVSLANPTYANDSRQAAAKEVKEIIDGVVALGNSSYGNRYVFGGFRTQTPPLGANGQYLGDDGVIFIQLDENNQRPLNVQARDLFEAPIEDQAHGHSSMIDCLQGLYTGLINDDIPLIHKTIEELDYQMDKTSSYQSTVGSIYNAMESVRKRLEVSADLTTQELSNIEDADIYRASSDFKRTETILQGTLMASNKLLQPSLLNFMQ